MIKPKQLTLIILLIALSSCAPKITSSLLKSYAPLNYKQEVYVIDIDQIQPKSSELLGEIKVGDSGFSTNCSYAVVVDQAKLKAREAGGNAIKITWHKPPSVMGSSCHRIKANILRIENIESLELEEKEEELLQDVDYAILNIYRYSGAGALVGYDLHLGDSTICRVKNNFKTTLHVTKEGLNTIWAKTESKAEVPIDIELGRTYYLNCGLRMGIMIGKPTLELVNFNLGKDEFESFNAKNK